MINETEKAEARFREARLAYIAAVAGYEGSECRQDRQDVKMHAQNYADDTHPDRAARTRDAARRLIAAVDRFQEIQESLNSEVAFALLEAKLAAQQHWLDAITATMQSVNRKLDDIGRHLLRREPVVHVEREETDARRIFDCAAATELDLAARAVEAAAHIVTLHRSTLRLFLKRHVERDPRTVLEAAKRLLVEDTFERTAQAVWEALKKTAPEVAEELADIARVASIYRRLQEKVFGMHVPFEPPRGVDGILILQEWVEEQVIACETAKEAVIALRQTRSVQTPQQSPTTDL